MPKIYFEKLNKDICDISKKPSPTNINPPIWWKKMDQYLSSEEHLSLNIKHRLFGTIKSCPAIQDSFNFGYMLYTPVDIYLDTTQKDEVKWHTGSVSLSDNEEDLIKNIVETVPHESVDGYPVSKDYHRIMLKFSTLWGVKTDPGYSTWFTSPTHRSDLPFRVLDGIVDTDTMPARSPFAFLLKNNFVGVIKAGTPMIQAIPFKRESWSSEYVDVDIKEYKKHKLIVNSMFTNPYKKIFWNRKKFS